MSRYWNFRDIYWHHENPAGMAMLLHTARAIYAEEEGGLRSYVEDTLWHGDIDALRYLDNKYRAIYHRPSLVHELEIDRTKLYRSLYTTEPEPRLSDDADSELFESLRALAGGAREQFCQTVATGLTALMRRTGRNLQVAPDEVLLDVPGRKVDSVGGRVMVQRADGEIRRLSEISEPVHFLAANYEALAKRARIFVSPRVAEHACDGSDPHRRQELQTLLRGAAHDALGDSDIR